MASTNERESISEAVVAEVVERGAQIAALLAPIPSLKEQMSRGKMAQKAIALHDSGLARTLTRSEVDRARSIVDALASERTHGEYGGVATLAERGTSHHEKGQKLLSADQCAMLTQFVDHIPEAKRKILACHGRAAPHRTKVYYALEKAGAFLGPMRVLRRRVRNAQEVEDISQCFQEQVIKSIHNYRQDGKLAAWMYAVLENVQKQYWSRSGRLRLHLLHNMDLPMSEWDDGDSQAGLEEQVRSAIARASQTAGHTTRLELEAQRDVVSTVIDALPQWERDIFVFKAEGWLWEDIAKLIPGLWPAGDGPAGDGPAVEAARTKVLQTLRKAYSRTNARVLQTARILRLVPPERRARAARILVGRDFHWPRRTFRQIASDLGESTKAVEASYNDLKATADRKLAELEELYDSRTLRDLLVAPITDLVNAQWAEPGPRGGCTADEAAQAMVSAMWPHQRAIVAQHPSIRESKHWVEVSGRLNRLDRILDEESSSNQLDDEREHLWALLRYTALAVRGKTVAEMLFLVAFDIEARSVTDLQVRFEGRPLNLRAKTEEESAEAVLELYRHLTGIYPRRALLPNGTEPTEAE